MLIYYVDLKPLGLIGLSFIVLLFPPRPLIFSPRKIKNKKIYSEKKKKEKKKYFQELKSTNRAIDLIKDIIIITIIIIKISLATKNFLEDEA